MSIQPYILIGGNSTRFGVDKATFEFDGETLAGRSLRTVELAFPESQAKFVGKSNGRFLGREVVGDVYRERGAAGAIHAALNDAETDRIFVVACDLPLVSVEFVRFLDGLADGTNGCVIPIQSDGIWQPLCAAYNVAKCLQSFEKTVAIDGRHPSVRTTIGTLDPRIVEFDEYEFLEDSQRLLMNLNSVADLESIQAGRLDFV